LIAIVKEQMLVTHQIAGVTFRTESDTPIPHLLALPFIRFQVDQKLPDVRYRTKQLDSSAMSLGPLSDDECESMVRMVGFPKQWLDKPFLRSPEIRARLRTLLDQPEMAHIDLRWNRVIIRDYVSNQLDLFYSPDKRADFSEPIFIAAYRNLLASFLLNFSAVALHSSGAIRNGTAAVFLAQDEGGKTSVVEQLSEETILNDDHVVLRLDGGIVTVHGSPFGPLTCGPRQVSLGGFFWLEKASKFELIPIHPWDVLQFLWNEHMHQWLVLPKVLRVRAYEILATACRQAVTYRMRFPKDYVDWYAIDKAMVE
jgi:hypothetical protein